MRLTKHHGLGNDFLVLLDPSAVHPVTPDLARAVCDRRRGIGADGLLRGTRSGTRPDARPETWSEMRSASQPGERPADLTMELWNSDGGRAEMSGNGISCLAQAAVLAGLAGPSAVTVATDAGVRTVRLAATGEPGVHRATVDMGAVKVGEDEPEWVDGDVLRAARVEIGNPHLVLHVPDLDAVGDLEAFGTHVNDLVPGGINVEIVTPGPEPGEVSMRVYERGAGLTQACGTGACAVAAVAARWELAGDRVRVHQPGGAADVVLGDTVELTVPVVHVATIEARL